MLSTEQWIAILGLQATVGIAIVSGLLLVISRLVRVEERVRTLRRDVDYIEEDMDKRGDQPTYKLRKKRRNDWPSPTSEKTEDVG